MSAPVLTPAPAPAPVPARPQAPRPALTVADLYELRERHLDNVRECWKRTLLLERGSEEREVWEARAVQHGHFARRLGEAADYRLRRGWSIWAGVYAR